MTFRPDAGNAEPRRGRSAATYSLKGVWGSAPRAVAERRREYLRASVYNYSN